MKYEVIRAFTDMTDRSEEYPNGRFYNIGDSFPAKGKVSKARLLELSTKDNIAGVIFIKPLGGDDNGANTDTSSIEG